MLFSCGLADLKAPRRARATAAGVVSDVSALPRGGALLRLPNRRRRRLIRIAEPVVGCEGVDTDADQEDAGVQLDGVIQPQQTGPQHRALPLSGPEPMPHGDDAKAKRGDGPAGHGLPLR